MVMMGDNSMGEAPEDLYHHMQVPELCKSEHGVMTRGLTLLESVLMAGTQVLWFLDSEHTSP